MFEKLLFLSDLLGRRTVTIKTEKVFQLNQKITLGEIHYKVLQIMSENEEGMICYKLKKVNYRGRKIQQTTAKLRVKK